MTSVTARAPAKVNLGLSVGRPRPDGYHPLATIFHAVDLYDEVRAAPNTRGDLTVEITYVGRPEAERDEVPLGPDNLAVRAAALLRDSAGIGAGVDLHLRKAIPVAGGMAGGSADAAAALVACDQAWELGTPRVRLERLAGMLGSDVPFCLTGGTALGTGRGDQISPVLVSGTFVWVFALSARGLPTPAVYAAYDRLGSQLAGSPQVSPSLLAALRAGNAHALGAALYNDLQEAALWLRPELADTLAVGAECDALGSVVSGSGPTVAFLAADVDHALDLALALTGAGVCADVVQAAGPVQGVRLVP